MKSLSFIILSSLIFLATEVLAQGNGNGNNGNGQSWKLGGNANTDPDDDFLGTTDSVALNLRVHGQDGLRILPTNSALFGNDTSSAPILIGGSETNSVGTKRNGGSLIAGGEQNSIADSSRNSVIGGGHDNSIEALAFTSLISGGSYNQILRNGRHNTISGGSQNKIGLQATSSTIAGGTFNIVDTAAHYATISGGRFNSIDRFGGSSVIGGGGSNNIQTFATTSVIAGGSVNIIGVAASNATISGGASNRIDRQGDWSTVCGGLRNHIGEEARFSTIAGGRELRVTGTGTFGYHAPQSNLDTMTIHASQVAVFGNTDLWLANNDDQASQLRLYERNFAKGAFPNGTHFTSFEAQSQATDIEYLLPASVGGVGDILAIKSVSGTTVTLEWTPCCAESSSISPDDSHTNNSVLPLSEEAYLNVDIVQEIHQLQDDIQTKDQELQTLRSELEALRNRVQSYKELEDRLNQIEHQLH